MNYGERKTYDVLRIRMLRRQGYTWTQIQERMGCCRNTVRRALLDDIDAFNAAANERKKRFRDRLRNAPKPGDISS